MSSSFTKITINGSPADIVETDDLPIEFDYELESNKDFQNKKGSKAVDIVFPATIRNQKIFNDFSNPDSADFTPGESHRVLKDVEITHDGGELLIGKAQLNKGTHTDKPLEYVVSCFGQNSDWAFQLKDKTLLDFVSPHTHLFDDGSVTLPQIQNSWSFDGMSETDDFVYAPVLFKDRPNEEIDNFPATYLTPSISIYWIIYRAFQSLGYKLESDFFDTSYFRRMVMPFTWYDFARVDPEFVDQYLFRAIQDGRFDDFHNSGAAPIPNYLGIGTGNNWVMSDTVPNAFDNNPTAPGNWNFVAPDTMNFFYPLAAPGGVANFRFYLTLDAEYNVNGFGAITLALQWQINGVGTVFADSIAIFSGGASSNGIFEPFTAQANVTLNPGDFIVFKIRYDWIASGIGGQSKLAIRNMNFFNDEVFRALGNIVNFREVTAFKQYPILDLIAGVFDYFDLQAQADSGAKVIRIEPYFKHALDGNPADTSGGYIKEETLNWSQKQDLSKKNEIELIDDLEQVQVFKARQDEQDGLQKLVRDRYNVDIGSSSYELPNRFKSGKKENENRFFSPVMHYRLKQMAINTGTSPAPQVCVIVPENVSQTSSESSASQFLPKMCYYKGQNEGDGVFVFNHGLPVDLPYMFQVNYNDGGEEDPVISYCDEQIGLPGSPAVKATGLMKRFYLQRLAIWRNGQRYNPAWFLLNQNDFQNWFHREFIHLNNSKWILKAINGFNNTKTQSVSCVLDKWFPTEDEDISQSFPSENSVMNGVINPGTADEKYVRRLCLDSDIIKATN